MSIGFVGLGNMGSGMAKNLLASGFHVVGFDSNTNKMVELSSYGLQQATSAGEIASTCDVVFLCLPNPEVSRQVIFEQLLTANIRFKTVIETSTLPPEIVREFARSLEAKGKQFLSSPMIGGKNHAKNGTIEFLVEGDNSVFAESSALFEAMGNTRYMGDIPSATLAKLSFNLSRYTNLAVGVEIHRLLKSYRANIPAIYEFMSEQSVDNFGRVWGEDLNEMMTTDVPYKPSQVPKKDLALLAEMAKSQGLDPTIIEAIRQTYISME